jgi:hypothetical protein
MQNDVVLLELEAAIARDAAQRTLEWGIVERLDLAAASAHEMVVVLPAGQRGLEARDPVGQIHAVHEPQLGQLVEDAIHAGDPDGPTLCAKPGVQLLRGHAAVAGGEVVEDGVPSSAGSRAGALELRPRMLVPGAPHGHGRR